MKLEMKYEIKDRNIEAIGGKLRMLIINRIESEWRATLQKDIVEGKQGDIYIGKGNNQRRNEIEGRDKM